MSGFTVVMCGVTSKDARMIEIVVSRAPSRKFSYQLVLASNATQCDIAVVDAQAPTAAGELAQMRQRFGSTPTVFISDDGTRGDSPHRVTRRSLLLHILRTLDEIAAQHMRGTVAASAEITKAAIPQVETKAAMVIPEPVKLEPLAALVVDDSLTVRTQLQGALERIGLKGTLAENGAAAIEAVQKSRFDLILLDVVMPGIDGYALCRQIKTAPATRSTPIVMLTSRSSPFDRARGALAGCDTYLTKPIDLKSFYRAVDKVLLKAFKENRTLMTERGYKLLALG